VAIERRGVFILHELEECPMKEVASLLGIPLFTAYSKLRVAREEFAAAVRRLQARKGRP
jgi:RNA polymerase sigma-70 factor (ECF subfamily)